MSEQRRTGRSLLRLVTPPTSPPKQPREHLRLTSAADYREHRVREGSYAQAISVGSGECIAICGHAVIICALATPPGSPCARCVAVVGEAR